MFECIWKYVGSFLFQRLEKIPSCKKRLHFSPTLLASLLLLPHAHAAPASLRQAKDDTTTPGNWSILGQILGWMTAFFVASVVTYVGVNGRPRHLTHYGVLSVGTCFTSFIFFGTGASAEVKWPTFVVGCIFLFNF